MKTVDVSEHTRAAFAIVKTSAPTVNAYRAPDWTWWAMQIPRSKLGRFALFFASEMFSFFDISVNNIALIHGFYAWTVITDMILVFQGMIISKLMIEDEKSRDWASIWGFTCGGATGSVLAIFVTKHLWR